MPPLASAPESPEASLASQNNKLLPGVPDYNQRVLQPAALIRF